MKPNKPKSKTVLDLMDEVRELERSPYVRLAQAEEVARLELQRRLSELRELKRLARSLDGINSLYHEELVLAAFGIDEKGESNDA